MQIPPVNPGGVPIYAQYQFMKPHRGTLILVLGILGLCVCGILGIAAWVMGNNDLREMRDGIMDGRGRDTTNAGRICGIIASVFLIAYAVAGVVFLLFFVLAASMR